MIATVTLNPAVDYTVSLQNPLQKNAVNRTEKEQLTPGGKGINVSLILHRLGIPTTAHGFLAGFTGTLIDEAIRSAGIPAQWIRSTDSTQMNRINLKLVEQDAVTEFNGSGIQPDAAQLTALQHQLSAYGKEDTIVLAGSIPKCCPITLYADLMSVLAAHEIDFAVDAESDALIAALSYHPFLIKPNLPELCALFAQDTILGNKQLLYYAAKLQEMGARNVLISLGGDGALLYTEDKKAYRMAAPQGEIGSTVGAGDSMLAGFLAGCQQKCSMADALRLGIAAGSATAFSPWLADAVSIHALLRTLPQPVEITVPNL